MTTEHETQATDDSGLGRLADLIAAVEAATAGLQAEVDPDPEVVEQELKRISELAAQATAILEGQIRS